MSEIGKINGKWAALFKILLAANGLMLPHVLAWGIWQTSLSIDQTHKLIAIQFRLDQLNRTHTDTLVDTMQQLQRLNPAPFKTPSAPEIRKLAADNERP